LSAAFIEGPAALGSPSGVDANRRPAVMAEVGFRPQSDVEGVGIIALMLAQDHEEHPVPEDMRPRFQELIAAFVAGDFLLSRHALDGIAPIDANSARLFEGQIAAYGDNLASLSDEVWQRSAYRWMDDHWDFVIDLTTNRESVSDLTLHAKLFGGPGGRIEVWSIHVP